VADITIIMSTEASTNGDQTPPAEEASASIDAAAKPQAAATAADKNEINIDEDDAPSPSITAVLEAANALRKVDEQVNEILADNTIAIATVGDNWNDMDKTGLSSAPAPTIEDIAEALSDGEEPFLDTIDDSDDGYDANNNGDGKPAYTAETAAAISSLMKGEEIEPSSGDNTNNNGGLTKKREISLQDRAHAMISVYHDYIQEEDDATNVNDDVGNGQNNYPPTSNKIPLHHIQDLTSGNSHDFRREEIKVATLEKFCKDVAENNYADNDDDESVESVQDDDYYDRMHTIQYPSQKPKPPKPTFRGPTAATTTAAFRLKAEVALKAVGSRTKKVAHKAVGAVKAKVKDGMMKEEDILKEVKEVENDYDFKDYHKKKSMETIDVEDIQDIQDEHQDDLEYGIANEEEGSQQLQKQNEDDGDDPLFYGMHIIDRDKSLKRKIKLDGSDEDPENVGIFNDLCDELGVTPTTHPTLRDGLHHFYHHPRTRYKYPIFRTKKFKQAMLYCGVLLLVLLICVSIISAVSNGFEEVHHKNAPGLPDWKEEDDWREKQKEDWEKDHNVDDVNVGGHDPAKVGITSQQQQDENELFQRVSAAYRPVWYDRSTGWSGQTYAEALTWCDSHDHYIPCPYEVYCPNETTLLAGIMDKDGESWAPVINADNEWVQVGNAAGRECDLYSTLYGKPPDWGSEENDGGLDNEEITRHIMCCRAHPDYDDEKGEGEHVMRPDGPPSTTNTEEESKEELSVTKSEELEILFLSVSKTYNPIWFDRTSGWKGQTYQESLDFCAKLDGYIPCPLKVYCPGGHGMLLDGIQDEGESWSAVIDTANDWVQVGEGGVCNLYSETAKELPSWGINGENNEEITRHIMCCQGAPHMASIIDSASANGNDSADATTDEIVTTSDTSLVISTNGEMPQPHHALTEPEVQILDQLHPVWFHSDSSGWKGTTYDDAKAFCESTPHRADVGGGTYHLCPISAYCPNGPIDTEPLYLQMEGFEGVQWAPISSADNAWVMVGKFNGQDEMTCGSYLEINHRDPEWGLDGTSPELKNHILCCEDYSDNEGSATDNGNGSAEPTTTDEAATDAFAVSNNEDVTAPSLVTMPEPNHALTESEVQILDLHQPMWFSSDASGWNGTTHNDAKAFCESTPHGDDIVGVGTYHLCPLSAYCPNGETKSEPLYLQMEAFEGVQWAPISSADNGWVMVGDFGDLTCQTYLHINHRDPEWGLDGSSTQLKNHILCCEDNTDVVVDIQPEVENSDGSDNADDTDGQPDANDSTLTEDTADNAKEPSSSMTALETQIQDAHHPAWFSSEFGWQGTNYQDAKTFCESIPYRDDGTLHLCPLAAYCPNGQRDIEPLFLQMDPFDGVQWAPISDGDNEWVMVGNLGDLTCQTYMQINHRDPVWGLDGTSTQLKEHLLCCEDDSDSDDEQASTTPSDGGDEGDGLTNMVVGIQEGVATSDGNTDANSGSEGGSVHENSITNTFNPMWFDLDQGGWDGGSHDEADQFCEQFAGSHGKRMELCPYAAYCPQGPSQPVLGGHQADFEEEGEQWAPLFGQNHWVMIGKRGTNLATTCLSHLQLTGEEPSWGLDGSNKEMKKHVMCCSPLQ